MADISKITLPDGSSYNIKDATARDNEIKSASVDSTGLITYKNENGAALFVLQLPLYRGGST